MYVVTVEFELHPDCSSEFIRLIHENAFTSLKTEEGCRQFDVCLDPKQPRYVFLYEVYDDRAAFDAHLATEHFGSFDLLSARMVRDKKVRLLERA
jgi:autoinducer 2-degrading protein